MKDDKAEEQYFIVGVDDPTLNWLGEPSSHHKTASLQEAIRMLKGVSSVRFVGKDGVAGIREDVRSEFIKRLIIS
jgi:hypothetical protein